MAFFAIPVAMLAGLAAMLLIDPESARGTMDYARNFQRLQVMRMAVLAGTGVAVLLLWLGVCGLVLSARKRSLGWLPLAAGGVFGFTGIQALHDHSPEPHDRYSQWLVSLGWLSRGALEFVLFFAIWCGAYAAIVVKRDFLVWYEALATGTPVAAIAERQLASSGMHAFSEGLQAMYLVVLAYLLWPVVFNLVARWRRP